VSLAILIGAIVWSKKTGTKDNQVTLHKYRGGFDVGTHMPGDKTLDNAKRYGSEFLEPTPGAVTPGAEEFQIDEEDGGLGADTTVEEFVPSASKQRDTPIHDLTSRTSPDVDDGAP